MAQAARAAAARPLLKIKLGSGDEDPARIRAIRNAAPATELIVDANEGWTPQSLAANLAACAEVGVTLIEQPLPAGRRFGPCGGCTSDPDLRGRKRA